MAISNIFSLSVWPLYALIPFVLLAAVLLVTRAYTTWNYYRLVDHFLPPSTRSGKKTLPPLQIPYTLPWLGNTLSFLTTQPGGYWQKLFTWHARSTGACSLVIGGRTTHIIYSAPAIQALFKDRTMKRDRFEVEMFGKVFAMSAQQIGNAQAGKAMEHEMNAKYLTRPERVNELTAKFIAVLDNVLAQDADNMPATTTPGTDGCFALYAWLREHMFTASMTALMGDRLLDMYPDYGADFRAFDSDFLSYFFGLPAWMMKDAIRRRERILAKLEAWSKLMHERSGGAPIDPEGPAWEPLLGSRLNRARQIDYKNRRLNARSSAALDLGITFGLASNVIPATGWMLMHVLDPKADRSLLPRVMADLHRAERTDGSIDVPTLVASPLLQSLWTETLRLYTDVLVTRSISQDTTLPLDEDGKTVIKLKKGDDVYAPCWLGHHDAVTWEGEHGGVNEFNADRYLVHDPANPTQHIFFHPKGNQLFPFGGGVTVCPGRFFAKQEALGALAMVLLRFDFDVLGFVDGSGKETSEFPGFANAFPGSGGLIPGGDMRVRVRSRARLN